MPYLYVTKVLRNQGKAVRSITKHTSKPRKNCLGTKPPGVLYSWLPSLCLLVPCMCPFFLPALYWYWLAPWIITSSSSVPTKHKGRHSFPTPTCLKIIFPFYSHCTILIHLLALKRHWTTTKYNPFITKTLPPPPFSPRKCHLLIIQ